MKRLYLYVTILWHFPDFMGTWKFSRKTISGTILWHFPLKLNLVMTLPKANCVSLPTYIYRLYLYLNPRMTSSESLSRQSDTQTNFCEGAKSEFLSPKILNIHKLCLRRIMTFSNTSPVFGFKWWIFEELKSYWIKHHNFPVWFSKYWKGKRHNFKVIWNRSQLWTTKHSTPFVPYSPSFKDILMNPAKSELYTAQ